MYSSAGAALSPDRLRRGPAGEFKAVHDVQGGDDNGLRLVSSVHFGRGFDNAFWDGTQMVYGDGSGKVFQPADQADWLIGAGILGTRLQGVALRSMKDPGRAHQLDRQPAHMRSYVDLPDDGNPRNDNGGVHINSGIPNTPRRCSAATSQVWCAVHGTTSESARPRDES